MGISRASAAVSVESAVREYYGGYEAYLKLKALDDDFDARIAKIKTDLYNFGKKYIPLLTMRKHTEKTQQKIIINYVRKNQKSPPSGTRKYS